MPQLRVLAPSRAQSGFLPVEQRRDESGSGGTGVDRRWNLGAADDAAAAPSAGAAEEASIIASHEGGRQGSRAGRPHVTTFEIL